MAEIARIFEPPFIDVPGALADIRAGRMVIVVDDEDRENEGDFITAARNVTRRWRSGRQIAGHLVAAGIHALRVGQVIALLQAELRVYVICDQ